MVRHPTLAAATWAALALLLVAVPLWGKPDKPDKPKPPADQQPAFLTVLVPPDAQVEIQGAKTTSKGEIRNFVSPPIIVGKEYVYTVKATWRDRTITREVPIMVGKPAVVDLRADFAKAKPLPPPAGKFSLDVSRSVTLKPGETDTVMVHVKRDNFNDAIELTFDGLPAGVKVPGATIPAGANSAKVTITAAKTAKPGSSKVTVHGKAGAQHATATFKLNIEAEEPPVGGRFTLTVPAALTLEPGDEKPLVIKVKRDNLDDPIEITFKGAPKGVKIGNVTIPAKKDSAEAKVTVDKDAKPGTAKVTVYATGGGHKEQVSMKLTIGENGKPPVPPPGK